MKISDKADDWRWKKLPEDQVIYASNCVQVLLQLHQVFRELLAKNELEKVAGLEFSALSPITEMEISGMYLDADSARALILRERGANNKGVRRHAGRGQEERFRSSAISLRRFTIRRDCIWHLITSIRGSLQTISYSCKVLVTK